MRFDIHPYLFFFSHRPNFFLNDRNKFNSVMMSREIRLVNTVTNSFNTIPGQMTEMSQRKKIPYS